MFKIAKFKDIFLRTICASMFSAKRLGFKRETSAGSTPHGRFQNLFSTVVDKAAA
jgi:hypothetical protein